MLGSITKVRESGYNFTYGNENYPNYETKYFSTKQYGSLAKAKAAALAYQKKSQDRLLEAKYGDTAKKYGLSTKQYVKLNDKEKLKLAVDAGNKRRAEAKAAKRTAERSFTYKGKTYAMPNQLPIASLPRYKNFIRYLNDYVINRKPGTSVVDSVLNIPAYKNEPIQARRKIRPNWERNQARIWRDLSEYFSKGEKGNFRNKNHIDFFKSIDVENLIPKKDHKEISTLKSDRVARQLTMGSEAALQKAAKGEITLGNPLVKPIAQYITENPNTTKEQLISSIRNSVDKNLTTKQISDGVERTHSNIINKFLAIGKGEKLRETQFMSIKDIDSDSLRLGATSLYRLYPDRIHRTFQKTVEEYYKDNPRLLKRSLKKLNDFEKIKKKIVTELDLKGSTLRDAPFQFDHPISLKALERSGNFEGTIRTNPIAGDVNQWKRFLDQKLNIFQKNIIAGRNIDTNLSKVEKLKNINQTLFGNLAGDFTMDAKGKINVVDYGAQNLLDPKYNITKTLSQNLPLGGFIKKTLASGKLTPEITELFGESGANKLIANSQKLVDFAKKDTNRICRIFGGVKLADGGQGCGAQMAAALDEDPVGTATKVQSLQSEGGSVNRIKSAATSFLNIAKKGGKFGALAAVGAAGAGAVKTFMNDDPTTYLSNEDQQKNMLIEMVTGQLDDSPVEEAPIGDAYLPTLGAVTVAGTAAVAPSTIDAVRGGALGAKKSGITKTALKTLGRGLTATATPLGLLATEPLYLAEQIQEGDSLAEIATNPFNYLGAAFAGPATEFATKGLKNSGIAKAMRLGISPGALKTVSRRFGLPGLALSLGISGYETFDDYRNKRGFFSEE